MTVGRFALFSWTPFEAAGGWNDLDGLFDTLPEAAAKVREQSSDRMHGRWQIVDLSTGEIVGHD